MLIVIKLGSQSILSLVVMSLSSSNVLPSDFLKLIRKGDISLVRALLAGGADPNGADLRRDTPLLVALAQGDREMARLLVDNGASLRGAVGFAVEKNDTSLASFVLTLGADPDDHWRGSPALHSCISVPMARLLIAAGCNLDARSADGWSAIHAVCRATPTDTVKELLLFLCACGSAVDVNTPHGRPQDFCVDRDSFFLLGAAGAELDLFPGRLRQFKLISKADVRHCVNFAACELAAARIDLIRGLAFEICLGLEPLRLPAFVTCCILEFACEPFTNCVKFHNFWDIATTVKHHFDADDDDDDD